MTRDELLEQIAIEIVAANGLYPHTLEFRARIWEMYDKDRFKTHAKNIFELIMSSSTFDAVEWLEEAIDLDLLDECYRKNMTTYDTLKALMNDCQTQPVSDEQS